MNLGHSRGEMEVFRHPSLTKNEATEELSVGDIWVSELDIK